MISHIFPATKAAMKRLFLSTSSVVIMAAIPTLAVAKPLPLAEVSAPLKAETPIKQTYLQYAQTDKDKAMNDIQKALAKMDKGLQSVPVPHPIYAPFEEGQLETWIKDSARARTIAKVSYETLQKFEKLNLPATRGTEQEMQYYKGPTAAENFARLKRFGEGALALETALNRDGAQAKTFLEKLDGYQAKLAQANEKALENFKLPKAQSKDKKRLKAAKAIMNTKKYGFGEYGPIVLTTKKIVERERKDKEINVEDVDLASSGDLTWSGTETVWTYKWDEFKFVTPVKDDETGHWHMWTITAKKFSSGGERTPIGKWVSGKSYKGSRILKKNF